MANTTFNGPVRSENGLKTISKNATTGVLTEQIVALSKTRICPDVLISLIVF